MLGGIDHRSITSAVRRALAAATFTAPRAAATPRSWTGKSGDVICAFDNMTGNEIADVQAMRTTPNFDVTAKIQAIIDSLYSSSLGVYTGGVYLPFGCYGIASAAQLAIRPGTRGFKLYGDGPRATNLVNLSTAGRDALWVGDLAGAMNYDVHLSGFRVQGNDSDGIGVKFHNTIHGSIRRVFTEYTGQNGFDINTSYDCDYQQLHARRAGYNGGAGRANVAGIKMTGGVAPLHFAVAEECNVGIICDTGSFVLVEPDTESNIVRGLQVQGAGTIIRVERGYQEKHAASNDDWLIGDGVNEIGFAQLIGGAIGDSAKITFQKTAFYIVDQYRLAGSASGLQIAVADPSVSRGYVGSVYPQNANSAIADHAVIIQHATSTPDNLPNNLIGTNGSFETDLVTNWNKRWLGGAGAIAITSVAGLGHDTGTVACKHDVTVSTSTYAISPTVLPVTVNGRYYMLDFSYTSSVDNLALITISTNGVRHFNYALPAATGQHIRIYFKAQGAITDFSFNITGVCALTLDDVSLYEGVRGRN